MKNLVFSLAVFLLVLSLLAACAPPSPAAEQPAPTEGQAASAAPKGGTLRVGWASEPDTMNPLTTYSTEGMEIIQLVYDQLLGYDTNLQPVPQLASEYGYSEDGKIITFKLRSNAKWHDGQPLTAKDVVFTYKFIKENEFGSFAQWLVDFEEARAVDDTTVELVFSKAQAFNPALVIPILPEHLWGQMTAEEVETFPNEPPIGSGPFKFVSWEKGATLTLEANPDFWGNPPAAAKIVFILYGNEDIMAQALRGGEIDIITEVPPTIWDGLQGAENIKAVELPSFSFHHIGFNVSEDPNSLGNPLLRDRVIRQALNYAVDRKQLVEVALAGHGLPGDSIIPAGLTDWHLSIPADKAMNGDPAKAIALLEGAGYKDVDGDGVREAADGAKLQFRLIAIETTSVDVRAAQLFRDAAEKVGIKLDLQTLDENTLGETVYNTENPDWDIFVWGWDSGVPDPNYMLGVPLCSQIGGNNDIFYCNPTYDELYAQQATTLDVQERKKITDQMQLMFYEDAAYIVMWYQSKLQAYRTDTWQGWVEMPGGMVYNFTRENYLLVKPLK